MPQRRKEFVADSIIWGGRKLISVVRLARELGYAEHYARELARSGKIPGEKVSGKWWFDKKAVIYSLQEKGIPVVDLTKLPTNTTPRIAKETLSHAEIERLVDGI